MIMKDLSMVEFFTEKDFDRAHNSGWSRKQYAEFCNRILAERGVRVYSASEKVWVDSHPEPSLQALLIAVQPIAKDSAESLLRECLGRLDTDAKFTESERDWIERARKVLAMGAE
jgi:hypothetical protein